MYVRVPVCVWGGKRAGVDRKKNLVSYSIAARYKSYVTLEVMTLQCKDRVKEEKKRGEKNRNRNRMDYILDVEKQINCEILTV